MNCHEFQETLSEHIELIDSGLPIALREHARNCRACGRFLHEQQLLSDHIARWSLAAKDSEQPDHALLTDRILAAWHSERVQGGSNEPSDESLPQASPEHSVQPAARPNQLAPRTRRNVVVLALASMALVVTAIVVPELLETQPVEQVITNREPPPQTSARQDPAPILPELLENTEQAYRVLAQRAVVSLNEVARLPLPARPTDTASTDAGSTPAAADSLQPEARAGERQYGSRIRKAVGFLFELVPDESTTL